MKTSSTQNLVAILGLFLQAMAGIKENGLWTGNDYYKAASKIGVENGVPYSDDPETRRRIAAAMTVDGNAEDYRSKPNVQRVMSLVDAEAWDDLFPIRAALYEYEGFLHAVGKFEAFCGESNLAEQGYSLEQTCARELAALFAHFGQETGLHSEDPDITEGIPEWKQGLYWVTEIRCTEGLSSQAGTAGCDYKQSGFSGNIYPAQEGVQYYGRGPFQLSWNYNYGAFSKVLVESSYMGKMHLLENPDLVHTDAYTVFTSALWFYMNPQSPKPSIHDVITGFMVPTDADVAAGITATFGTTINIINGGHECGKGSETAQAAHRIEYYEAFLDHFDLPDEGGMSCSGQSLFPTGGYGDAPGYFHQSWDGTASCIPVKWQTGWTIYARDDYKRCVCDFFGDGEADCGQAAQADSDDDDNDNNDDQDGNDGQDTDDQDQDGNDDQSGDDDQNDNDQDNNDDQSGGDDDNRDDDQDDSDPIVVSDPEAAFDTIHANPHYSNTQKSRTMYQVDRSMDYIEQKLAEIQAVFVANNFIQ